MSFYRGYSTVGVTFQSSRLEDIELIKRDLMNHFQIRRGEKLMNPDFGCIVWDHIYDPLTEDVKQSIVDDVTLIAHADSRTDVTNIIVSEYEHGIQLELDLLYVDYDQSESLLLSFNNDSTSLEVSAL